MSALGPVAAVVLYPRAKWLFAFVLIGIVLLVLLNRFREEPSPQELADDAERLLNGIYRTSMDVDSYEHRNPRNPQVRDLWLKTMQVGGLPEEWVRLDETGKNALRDIIRSLRNLGNMSDTC